MSQTRTQAAAPAYLRGINAQQATPEMRYGLLLSVWEDDWRKTKETGAFERITPLDVRDLQLMEALLTRQQRLQIHLPADSTLVLNAKAIAPFATGLGNEHPLENGFAFLNPYGLPYLAGSGVKGVLRRAAEELAGVAPGIDWATGSAWTQEAVDLLFGQATETHEGENKHTRGVLSFWDVIPQIKGRRLNIEIMTPHLGEYYQGKATPNEANSPIPIKFLTIPPGSEFVFHVCCDTRRLRLFESKLPTGERWQALLTEAFEHAFDWCGFGAKTAVGYGAMQRDVRAEVQQQEALQTEQEKQREAAELNDALQGLAEDAQALKRQKTEEDWENDNNKLLDGVEVFLQQHPEPSADAMSELRALWEAKWPGILTDPNATTGRRNKPKYKPRPKALAERMLALAT